jgi:hypothetical protein
MNSLEYLKRLQDLDVKIRQVSNPRSRIDLTALSENPRQLLSELSREEVEVRRIHRNTIKYTQLQEDLDRALSDLENFITFALLKS